IETGEWRGIDTDLEPHDWMAASSSSVILVAASATRSDSVVRLDLASGQADVLRASSSLELDRADVSVAQSITFPTTDSDTAHAFYYAPTNAVHHGSPDERPPLIAISHGGPTTATNATL